ncbi:MAG: hypothetical protein WBD10_14360, partial [Acidobacteriaceae bacterium]
GAAGRFPQSAAAACCVVEEESSFPPLLTRAAALTLMRRRAAPISGRGALFGMRQACFGLKEGKNLKKPEKTAKNLWKPGFCC